jgi:hypothetical protein
MSQNAPTCLGKIFAEGFCARRTGVSRAANPHKADDVAADAWFAGWDEAAERSSKAPAEGSAQ